VGCNGTKKKRGPRYLFSFGSGSSYYYVRAKTCKRKNLGELQKNSSGRRETPTRKKWKILFHHGRMDDRWVEGKNGHLGGDGAKKGQNRGPVQILKNLGREKTMFCALSPMLRKKGCMWKHISDIDADLERWADEGNLGRGDFQKGVGTSRGKKRSGWHRRDTGKGDAAG